MVSAVLVKVDPGTTPADVAREIQQQVPETKTITPDGLLSAVSGNSGAVTRILYRSTASSNDCVPFPSRELLSHGNP